MGKASRRRKAGSDNARGTRTRDLLAASVPFVARPFEGLTGETDWVAIREVVPAATATVTFAAGAVAADGPQTAIVATVLPGGWSGLRRADGAVMVALQSGSTTGDASRDIAQVLLATAAAEAGTPLPSGPLATAATPRLQDVLDPVAPFEVTVHDGFDFWVPDTGELDDAGKESLERANAAALPTTKMESAPSAYWCRVGMRTYLRWVLPHNEDAATDALSRLHAASATSLGEDTRLLGAFRACGLLVPVWDLDPSLDAADYEHELARLAVRLDEALAQTGALSAEERRARSGLLSRQVTLR
ncbi:MAG: topoisomerase II [Actinobacteria bacterium]|nr:topoisomerase II [Actinomycetota bacterium]